MVIAVVAFSGFATKALSFSRRTRRNPSPKRAADDWVVFSPLEWLSIVTLSCMGGIGLVTALAPVTSWDAAVAHLALPEDYAREGRFLLLEGNAYSAYPHLLHALFTLAFYGGGEAAAQLVSWVLALLACGGVYCLGRRLENRKAGLVAAAVFATTPIFIDQAGVPALDLAFSGMVAATLACLVAWREEEHPAWLGLAGFLAGGACGIRHTGYLVGALLFVAVAGFPSRSRLRHLLIFAVFGMAGAAPWLFRSAWLVGNPVYPFFAGFFASHALPDADITSLASHESVRSSGLIALLRFPWDIVMHPERYDGWAKSPGGIILALGIPTLFVGRPRVRWVGVFCVAGVIALFFFRQSARYLLPFFAPMMAVAGVATVRMPRFAKPVAVVLVTGYAFGLLLGIAAVHFKVPVVLGMVSREEYLAERVERYRAFQWVNEHVPPDRTVLTLDMRSYYIRGRTYQNLEGLRTIVACQLQEQLKWLQARGIQYILVPHGYVAETPGLHEVGLAQMWDSWWSMPNRFVLVKRMDLENPRSGAVESVGVYEIHYEM